jgi:hypothetical protein
MSVASTLEDIRSKEHDIDKYLYLRDLQRSGTQIFGDHQEHLPFIIDLIGTSE